MANEMKTYEGSCHCGEVRFTVSASVDSVVSCNCSICHRSGTLLTFVPATAFELLSGREALRDYQFGKKQIHHLFCSTCGIRSFGRGAAPDGTEMVAVNVRCLEGVELDSFPVQHFDGKSL